LFYSSESSQNNIKKTKKKEKKGYIINKLLEEVSAAIEEFVDISDRDNRNPA